MSDPILELQGEIYRFGQGLMEELGFLRRELEGIRLCLEDAAKNRKDREMLKARAEEVERGK